MASRISPEFSRLVAWVVDTMNPTTDEEKALKQYIRLILMIAKKYVRNNVEYEDLIMAGSIGLVEAVRHFDITRSTNFKAYAITRIKGRMYEYCISNMTTISVPTHVGKTKVYAERMTRILDQEPYLFSSGVSTHEIISEWEHPSEEHLGDKAKEQIRTIKGMVNKIAINSKTTYKKLISYAYKSMVTELGEEDAREFITFSTTDDIETDVTVNEVVAKLKESIGEKKTTVLVLHHQKYNNEDIADELFKRGLTPRRITRQAVRGLLRSAEEKARKNVKR